MRYLLFLFLTVVSFGQIQNLLDLNNTTSLRLGANKTYTGYATDNLGSNKFTSVVISVTTDKASATGGFKFQVSNDSTSWYTTDSSTSGVGLTSMKLAIPLMRYFRVKYINGADSITASYFIIQTFKTTMPIIDADIATSVSITGTVQTNGTIAGSSNFITKNGTSVAALDSLVFNFTSVEATIINDATSSDTMFISPTSTFPTATTLKRIGGEYASLPIAWTKLYFKFGTTATASKNYRLEVK